MDPWMIAGETVRGFGRLIVGAVVLIVALIGAVIWLAVT